jgi:hypothetical protein
MGVEGERKRVVSFEDMEVFQRAYRVVARDPSSEPDLSGGGAACSGRSDPAGFQIHLRQSCRRLWSSEGIEAGVCPLCPDGDRFVRRDAGMAALCLLGYIDEPTWQGWREEYQVITRMLQSLADKV